MPLQETIEEAAKKLMGLRVAHEAAMVEDAAQVLRQAREQVASHHQTMTGQTPVSEDDMGIHVGDINYTTPQQPITPAGNSSMPEWAKLLLTALGTGGSIVGYQAVVGSPEQPVVVQPAEKPETTWQIGVGEPPK